MAAVWRSEHNMTQIAYDRMGGTYITTIFRVVNRLYT